MTLERALIVTPRYRRGSGLSASDVHSVRMLVFLETPVFTRRITALLSDSEYAALQGALIVNPEAGDLIPGTGGLRKIR